jgi:hypothetical protein
MDEALNFLQSDDRFESPSQIVGTYSIYIGGLEVRVEVHDFGTADTETRYMDETYAPDVPRDKRVNNSHGAALGNPQRSIEDALSEVHWAVYKS